MRLRRRPAAESSYVVNKSFVLAMHVVRRRRRTAAETLTAASTHLFLLNNAASRSCVTLIVTARCHIDCPGAPSRRSSRRAVTAIVTVHMTIERVGVCSQLRCFLQVFFFFKELALFL